MKQMKKLIKTNIYFNIFLMFIICAAAQKATAQNLYCKIIDSRTLLPVQYANAIYRKLKISAKANDKGLITIEKKVGEVLEINSIGYKTKRIKIKQNFNDTIQIKIVNTYKSLQTVTIKAKRKNKYSRKNNPAVELMKRVIAAKKATNLENHNFYRYDKYQKLTMALNNISEDLIANDDNKKEWLKKQVERCPYNDKLILPFSVDETFYQHIFRKTPKKHKDIIKGQSTKGISQLIQTGNSLNTIVKDLFQDIDIYKDQIELLQSRFPSPIGATATSFYRFYIEDTVQIDKQQCIKLQFMPGNQQDFGFRGEIYIVNDSSLHVKKLNMQLPANTGVNWIDAMKISQEFKQLDNKEWVLTADKMVVELKVIEQLQSFIIIRSTKLNNYNFQEIDPKLFSGSSDIIYEKKKKKRNEEFWKEHRAEELTKGEKQIDNLISKINNSKLFKNTIVVARAIIENFIETGGANSPSKIDIGPINTFISKNYIDGIRLRAAARTTANLNKHWFAEGYYAYGIKSKTNYYGGKLIYSFNKPQYLPIEFPTRTITFETYKDIESPSDKFLKHNKDNIFMAIKPVKAERLYKYERQKLSLTWESINGITSTISAKTEKDTPLSNIIFKKQNGNILNSIRTTELELSFEYRPGQKYITSKQKRKEVNKDAPKYIIKQTFGLKNLLNGQYQYNLTELKLYKRFWMGSYGKIDLQLSMGAQWNKVPYNLLCQPAVNTSFFEQQATFNLMREMEFLNDRYAQINISWKPEGKIFNRIPLIKKLKLREYIAIKSLWGKLTNKNNPRLKENINDNILFQLPTTTNIMTKQPYIELVIGVHNIFKMFEINYIRRLTYTNLPNIKNNGIRFGFNLTF